MGKIISESHIYTGGVEREVAGRTNELIVVLDCHEEEGYGVYLAVPWSDTDSFTTSFGYGPMAEILSREFFKAVSNYYTHLLESLPAETDLSKDMPDDSEFGDHWFKVFHKRFGDGELTNELDPEQSYQDGLEQLLAFTSKWHAA